MNINIKAPTIELTEEIKDYVQEKMDMLEKYLGSVKVINCDVEVGITVGNQNSGPIYKAEVNMEVPGKLIRVEKNAEDLFKAIDKTKDHLMRSIKRYKEKKVDRLKKERNK
jgi:putative sigma-54 modulation protein